MDKNNKPSAIDYSPMNDAHWKLLDAVTKYLEASRSILLSGSYNDEFKAVVRDRRNQAADLEGRLLSDSAKWY